MNSDAERLDSIHALRGIAALLVCLYHLGNNTNTGAPAIVSKFVDFGQYGVTMFFVISGFVLPFSMIKSQYTWKDFPKFMWRRCVRIEPPYIASIVLLVTIGYLATLTPGYRGQSYSISIIQIFLNITYLAPIFGTPWIEGVFWTLCVELQFYLILGLAFSFLIKHPLIIVISCCIAVLVCGYELFPTEQLPLGQRESIIIHLPVFMVGFAMLLRTTHQIKFGKTIVIIAVPLITISLTQPMQASIATVIAAIIIATIKRVPAVFIWLGTISYSLYLTHAPFAMRGANVISRLGLPWFVTMAIALILMIAAAFTFWRLIERPAHHFATQIKLRPKEQFGIEPSSLK